MCKEHAMKSGELIGFFIFFTGKRKLSLGLVLNVLCSFISITVYQV